MTRQEIVIIKKAKEKKFSYDDIKTERKNSDYVKRKRGPEKEVEENENFYQYLASTFFEEVCEKKCGNAKIRQHCHLVISTYIITLT